MSSVEQSGVGPQHRKVGQGKLWQSTKGGGGRSRGRTGLIDESTWQVIKDEY